MKELINVVVILSGHFGIESMYFYLDAGGWWEQYM